MDRHKSFKGFGFWQTANIRIIWPRENALLLITIQIILITLLFGSRVCDHYPLGNLFKLYPASVFLTPPFNIYFALPGAHSVTSNLI